MPKVSICIPAYKDVNGIRRLLNSIKLQTYKDFEIIITDDTPDNSIENVLTEYSELSITYHHNEKPLGACLNWNKSLDLATGEYIKIMHQDDSFTFDDSLYSFVQMLDSNPDAIMAFSGSRQVTINPDSPLDMSNFYDRCISDDNLAAMQKDYRDLYNGDWVGAPSATIFKNCNVRFDPKLTWIIDVDFYIALLSTNSIFICSKEPLISIGVSDEQLTNRCKDDAELNIREYRHVMEKYKLNEFAEYRQKLCKIAVLYKQPYSKIKDLIPNKSEYSVEYKARQKYLLDFYKKLIIRKLTGK